MNTDVAREPLLAVSSVDVDIAGRRLVAGLTFGAQRGEFIAVLGENGVGKTLTLHTLAGLRPAAAGSISKMSTNKNASVRNICKSPQTLNC